MDAVPAFSAFTAATELVVTAAVFYVFYRAIADDVFEGTVLAGAIAYEIVFNVSYMVSRLFTHDHTTHHPDWLVALLAGHGILSFVMFVALIAFAYVAYRRQQEGGNLFAERAGLTYAFAVFWTISLLSGEAIFVLEYVFHL